MKRIRIVFLIFAIVVICANVSDAKWWIFGQSAEDVSISYLYLNKVAYEESGPAVTIYKETLQDGMILITGKASVKKGSIGLVQVSINDKETWEKAQLSANGTFQYSFKPDAGKKYIIYVKIVDTSGKNNDVDATRKEVTVSGESIQSIIKEALDKMIEEYRNEDAMRFMSYVSDDFEGDETELDRTVRKDFSAFENIDIRYTINNISSGAKGIFVSLNYNRSAVSSESGQMFSDSGITGLVFKIADAGPKAFDMKHPLMFGLSDTAKAEGGDEASSNSESGSFTLKSCSGCPVQEGFIIEDNSVVSDWTGDINLEYNLMFLHAGVAVLDLGVTGISSVTSVPDSGYAAAPFMVNTNIGHCFAFKLANGKYAVIEIISWTDLGSDNSSASFRYKYQPDGSRDF